MAPPRPALPGIVPERVRTVLCDLDGVVWLAHQPIPGSVEALERLRAGGRRVLFVTNNSAARITEQEAALAAIGIEAVDDVVTSSQAAASLLAPGDRALVTGGPGVAEAIERAGAVAVANDGTSDPGPVDAVVVGRDRRFDFDRLAVAASALHAGARLIATNDDATFPTPQGLEPGGGAIVAAVATAGETTPVIAGKPHEPMARLIAELLRPGSDPFDPGTAVMVGDRPSTDGLFAATLGCPFALVRSGVLAPGEPAPAELPVAADLADLAQLADRLSAAPPTPG
ncbi:MAG: HAD-IIA family hydrolase [Ilumatobacteraceae bacterium]